MNAWYLDWVSTVLYQERWKMWQDHLTIHSKTTFPLAHTSPTSSLHLSPSCLLLSSWKLPLVRIGTTMSDSPQMFHFHYKLSSSGWWTESFRTLIITGVLLAVGCYHLELHRRFQGSSTHQHVNIWIHVGLQWMWWATSWSVYLELEVFRSPSHYFWDTKKIMVLIMAILESPKQPIVMQNGLWDTLRFLWYIFFLQLFFTQPNFCFSPRIFF